MAGAARALWGSGKVEILLVLLGVCMLAILLSAQYVALQPDGIEGRGASTAIGVPLDDVYIHCRFAQNLARGDNFSFNPGEAVSADTSPLWVVLIALGGLVTPHLEIVAVLLSSLFYLALGPGVFRVARDVFGIERRWAVMAGICVTLSSRILWAAPSGMEVTLAALLMLLIVEEHARQIQRGTLRHREWVLLGVALLVRPEFFFVAVLSVADWLVAHRQRKIEIRKVVTGIAIAVSLALPFMLFNAIEHGGVFSHSSKVQGAHASLVPNVGYLWFVLKILASHNVLLFVAAILSLPLLRNEQWRFAIIVTFGLPLALAFVAPQFRHHGRYIFPILPVLIIAAAAKLCDASHTSRYRWSPRPQAVLVAAVLLLTVADAARWIVIYAQSVRNISDQHLAAAEWVEKNTSESDVVAVHDIGAIGYFTNKRLLDLTGLATPELHALMPSMPEVWERARDLGANVFIVYDRLNASFFASMHDSLDRLAEFRVRGPLVASADTVMTAYRIRQ